MKKNRTIVAIALAVAARKNASTVLGRDISGVVDGDVGLASRINAIGVLACDTNRVWT